MNCESGHQNGKALLLARLLFLVALVWFGMGMGNVVVAAAKTKITRSPRDATAVIIPKQFSLPAMPTTAIASASVAPMKQTWLMWDAPSGVSSFVVYVGNARDQWTNHFTVTTNSIPIDTKLHYGVAALFNDAESVVAYWPSNRIERLVNEIYEYPGGPKVGEQVWITYTNTLPGSAGKFQRIRQELIGWL